MKNIKFIKIMTVVGIMMLAGSCELADGRVTYGGPYYVQFTDASAEVSEAAETSIVSIQVSNVGPTLDTDITVNYSTDGSDAVEGVDYELVAGTTSGTIVIPAGEHFGTLELSPINNADPDGLKTLTLTLTGASSGLAAGSGAIGVSYSLSITDDDCPLDLTTFPGSYDMNFTHTAGFLWGAGFQEGFVSTLIPTTDPNTFDCENFFGIVDRDGLGSLGSPSLGLIPIVIDDVAETAAIAPGDHFFYFSGGTAQRDVRGTGSGPVGTCGPTFSLSGDIVRTADGSIGTSFTIMNFAKIE